MDFFESEVEEVVEKITAFNEPHPDDEPFEIEFPRFDYKREDQEGFDMGRSYLIPKRAFIVEGTKFYIHFEACPISFKDGYFYNHYFKLDDGIPKECIEEKINQYRVIVPAPDFLNI